MSAGPWLVPVTALRRAPGSRRPEHRSGPLGELRVADTYVPDHAAVDVEVVLSSILGGIEVTGTVQAPWEATCRRCLRPVGGLLEAPVRELYRPRSDAAGDDDEETYELGVDHLDLAPLARDALLLSLPLAPLCRPDCPGLCPTCGQDLAEGPCGCAPVVTDPRWAALDALVDTASGDAPAGEVAPDGDLEGADHPQRTGREPSA